jgi:ABC-type arginine transport system permease subunit
MTRGAMEPRWVNNSSLFNKPLQGSAAERITVCSASGTIGAILAGLLGLDISPLLAAALGLTLFTSAFLAEIWRGCVQSIPEGQWEATDSLESSVYIQYVLARIAEADTLKKL